MPVLQTHNHATHNPTCIASLKYVATVKRQSTNQWTRPAGSQRNKQCAQYAPIQANTKPWPHKLLGEMSQLQWWAGAATATGAPATKTSVRHHHDWQPIRAHLDSPAQCTSTIRTAASSAIIVNVFCYFATLVGVALPSSSKRQYEARAYWQQPLHSHWSNLARICMLPRRQLKFTHNPRFSILSSQSSLPLSCVSSKRSPLNGWQSFAFIQIEFVWRRSSETRATSPAH